MMMVIIIISDVCRKLLRKLEFLRVFATPYLVTQNFSLTKDLFCLIWHIAIRFGFSVKLLMLKTWNIWKRELLNQSIDPIPRVIKSSSDKKTTYMNQQTTWR